MTRVFATFNSPQIIGDIHLTIKELKEKPLFLKKKKKKKSCSLADHLMTLFMCQYFIKVPGGSNVQPNLRTTRLKCPRMAGVGQVSGRGKQDFRSPTATPRSQPAQIWLQSSVGTLKYPWFPHKKSYSSAARDRHRNFSLPTPM